MSVENQTGDLTWGRQTRWPFTFTTPLLNLLWRCRVAILISGADPDCTGVNWAFRSGVGIRIRQKKVEVLDSFSGLKYCILIKKIESIFNYFFGIWYCQKPGSLSNPVPDSPKRMDPDSVNPDSNLTSNDSPRRVFGMCIRPTNVENIEWRGEKERKNTQWQILTL